jgi:methionyl-tRNA formyltransferase
MSLILKAPLPERPGIVFMGTPDFAVSSLKSLIDAGHDIRAVVTQPDRPKGRGRNISPSPVKLLALKHNIKVLQPEKVSEDGFLAGIKEEAPDLIIVVAFGQILKKILLEMPRWGVINIHASLLPKYRGAAPIQRVILNNESSTGLTIMRMDEGLDTGPILYQKEIQIMKDETSGQLHDRLAGMSGGFLMEFLGKMMRGQIGEKVQDSGLATYAEKIDKTISRIEWNRDAAEISALIRALDPAPGAFTTTGDNNVKLYSSSVPDDTYSGAAPGRVLSNVEGVLRIETGKGIIGVKELQCPGKKRLHVREFLMGYHLPEGIVLGQ